MPGSPLDHLHRFQPAPAAGRLPSRALRVAGWLLWIISVSLLALIVFAWTWPSLEGRSSRAAEWAYYFAVLTRTFAFQLGVASCVLGVLALLLRRYLLVLLILLPLSLHGALPETLWMLRPSPIHDTLQAKRTADARRPDLIVLSFNTHQGRFRAQELRDAVIEHDADVVVVQEISEESLLRLLVVLETTHPHWAHLEQDWLYGQAIFSKHPLVGAQRSLAFADPPPTPHPNRMRDGDRQQQVTILVDGKQLVIQNVHMISPMNPTLVAEQARQTTGMIELLSRDSLFTDDAPPLLIVGDFNATWRSPMHARLRKLGLKEAHALVGQGRGTTWPAHKPILDRVSSVRIDHAMMNRRLVPRFARALSSMGSDHRSIVVGLDFAPDPIQPAAAPQP